MKPTLPNFLPAFASKISSFKNLSALVVLLLFSGAAWAQSCANYAVARTTGITYSSIASTGTSISGTWRNALSTDDNLSAAQNIGFTFYYRGVAYTQFSISTNGFLTFNTGTTAIGSSTGAYGYQNSAFSSASGSVTTLAPFYDDQQTAGNLGTQSDLNNTYKYLLSGTAGSRVATIEWVNSQDYSSTSTSSFNYQINLYESDGHIEFIYGAMTLANTSTISTMSYSLGINGQTISATPTIAELLTQQTVNTTTFSATASNALGGATPGNMPEANSMISFTPTSTTAPTSLTFSNISSGAMRLNWTDNSSDELGFIIERSTDNITYTTVSTQPANAATYGAVNLAANTNYYFKVSPLREAKGTALSGNQITAAAPTLASVISIDGNAAVPGTSYPTITEAVADLGGTIASAITIQLTSTYVAANETYPIQLPYVAGSSAANTLTIVQANGVSGTIIDSSNASSTFIIDGGNYWIIDGRSGGTGSTKDLVISNSSVTGTAIQLINDASYNTLKYCTFKGVNTSATSGVVVIGSTTTTAATGNDYNTITYCDVRDGATTPTNCIYSSGPALGNNNSEISYNNIYNFFSNTVVDQRGIFLAAGTFDCTVNNNSVFQTSTRTFTVTGAPGIIGIHVNNSTGYNNTISNNYIGGTAPLADTSSYLGGSTGSMTYTLTGSVSTHTFLGIRISTSGILATCPITNNIIKNISVTSANASSTNSGISVSSGSVNINGNTIGDLNTNNSVVFITSGTSAGFNGILTGSGTPGNINITNNSIGGISISGTGTVDLYGIYAQGTNVNSGSNIITSNTIGSTTLANSITNSTNKRVMGIYCTAVSLNNTMNNNIITNLSSTGTTTTSPANRVFGIYTVSTTGIAGGVNNINGNSVKNLTTSSALVRTGTSFSASTTSVVGIYASAITTTSNVSSNTVSGLLNSNTTSATSVVGIIASGPAVTYYNTVEKNNVYNIGLSTSSVSTTLIPMIMGIWIAQGLTTVKNNVIRLGSNSDGTSYTGGAGIYGLYDGTGTIASGTFSAYHNTIYIGGTNATSTLNTFAFYSGNTGSRDIRNNIFFNARSNSSGSGTGKHYSIWINNVSTTLSLFNYNDYLASGTGGVFGFYNSGVDRTDLTAWRTASGQDANSINSDPCLNAPTAATPNLHLTTCSGTGSPAEGTGVLISSVTDDFDGDTRSSLSPTDMGADAGNYGNTGSDMKAAALVSPTTTGCKTATETVSVSVTNMSSVAIDFSVNNVTIAVTATGGYSSSVVLSTGTLAAGSSQTVTMPATIDLTANGTYTFNASTSVTGDINTGNDAMAASSVIIFGGTYTVGTGGNYATIAAAVTAYNAAACFSSNVVFSLTDAAYDIGTTALTINQNANSGAYTLTIKPAVGVSPTITGAVASSAIFNIRAKNVIIDGSNTDGGTTRNLTITNTSTTSPYIIIIGNSGTSTATSLTDVTLKNTILINGVNTSTAVIVANNLAAAGYFNNITIQNNSVQKAYIGIYALATVATGNGSGLLITGNDLNTSGANAITSTGIYVQGVDGATVSNNNIGNITSSTLSPTGIWFATATNSGSISGNTITALSYTGTTAFGPRGINLTTGTTTTAISVSNNTISNLTGSGTSSPSSGIYTTSVNSSIFNNKISNIKNTNSGGYLANGIFLASTSTTAGITLYNNFIFDIAGYGYSSTVGDNGYGIVLYSGGGYNLYNNTINMNTNQTQGYSGAIYIYSSLVTAASVNIRNNIFANTQTAGAPEANRYAIYSAAANTIFGTIDHNDYYSTGTNLGYLGSARTNVAGIVTGFGGNANSISVLPTFTSATDLHLTAAGNCSINNAGTPISGITTDYDGATRSTSTPDIGADEFTGDINTAGAASSTPTLCNNTILTNITHATTVATGIGTATGLPTGVTAAWASNTITISGTPSATGTFNYTIPLSGGTCTVNATGTITVNPSPTALVLTGSLVCAGTTGSITSSTSVSGVDYQLYDSANAAVGSVQAGTGSGLTWSSIAIGTGYYANATNSTTSCVSSNSNNVAVGTITDKTWIGGTSTSWNTASNWSCGTLPSASDVIIISSGSPVLDTNFTVGSGGSLTISGTSTTFTISPTSTLTIVGATNFGDKAVTIKSNSTGNGAIGQVTGTLSGATNVTVERYIPAKRSWRAITAPVTMTTSINANWQEGSPGTGNGYGFDIWSNSGGTGIITGGTGSSLLAYDSTTNNTWSAITNTTTASSMMDGSKNKPFMAFVTGPYGTNNVTAGATETTLRATGTLLTGDKTYPTVANKYTFIGNPYASPLDLTAVLNNTSNATASFGGNVWVWDANVLGTYSVGTYNLFDFAASNYSYTSSNANISGAQIQSGQAFFVKSTDGANFSIKEAHKGSVFTNAVFRSGAPEILRVNLYKQVNNEWPGRDGTMTVILADANANQTPNKMANGTENIAFTKNGANFASNHHLPLVATDVLNVKVWNTTAGANYKLKINTEQFATTNLSATLEDLFTNARTPLSLDGSAVEYPFSATTDALSTGNRFRIVFQTAALSTTIPKATGFSIVPNPVTGDSFQVNLGTLATGSYSYSICNAIGQEVEKGSINNATQNTNYTVKFRETAATGIYIMKIKGSDNSVFTAKLIKK
ncbi:MAG: hypothetical protein QE264_01490 [Flavobacterium sp.]|nr:hypothetical protein [Flavobacterium sp.]